MPPFVTIIIPTYNDWTDLSRCIGAIDKQSYPKHCFEVIIANNNPNNPVPDDFRFMENSKLIDVARPGSYSARNAAIAVAKGSIIAFTDADCMPAENWLETGVDALQKNVDRVAGRVQLYFSSDKQTAAELYEKAFAFRQDINANQGLSVTANLFVWRELFRQVGSFDATLMSGGDIAWNREATQKGLSIVYEAEAVVYHPARASFKELKKKRKRVVGGLVSSNGLSVLRVITGIMPPINTIGYLKKRKDLSFKNKILAFLVQYYLKIYGIYTAIKFKLGIERYTRS